MGRYFKLMLFIGITFLYCQVVLAQSKTEADDVREFLKQHPSPKGTYSSLDEAKRNPEKVLHLIISGIALKSFPEEILRFKKIQELDLSNNEIQVIPTWIQQLSTLKILILRGNKIKTLPGEVFLLPNLKELDAWGNEIGAFSVSIGKQASKLQDLDLSMNRLESLPLSIKNLNNLKKLRLESDQFMIIPSEIFQMMSLENVYLYHNKITDFICKSPLKSRLKFVFLNDNPITETKLLQLRRLLPSCNFDIE